MTKVLNLSKRRFDYLLTFVTEFAVLLAGVLVYRFAAGFAEQNAFAGYALSRRVVSFIQPILILGMGVGLPRYISIAVAKNKKHLSNVYFIAASTLVISFTAIVLSALMLFPGFFSVLFFGENGYAEFMPGIATMLLGLVLHSLTYSYFRGLLKMYAANAFQIINLGIIPIVAFVIGSEVVQVLTLTGLGWVTISVVFMFITFARVKIDKTLFIPAMKEILFYGIQRVPGDLAIAGLFSIPAFLVAHIGTMAEAGNVAFGISLLNMAGAVFGPICLILLPEASKMIVAGDFKRLFGQIRKISILTFSLTVIGLILFEGFAEEILTIYLGKADPGMVFTSRLILLGSIGYTIYVSLRSILDAYYVKAVNTINIILSLLLYIVSSGLVIITGTPSVFLTISFVVSVILLGLLTIAEILKIKRQNE